MADVASAGRAYLDIVRHYEACLAEHGSGPRAVDWKSPESAEIRYDVMLGLLGGERGEVSLLDFGCGLADLHHHILARGFDFISYEGLDISPAFAAGARARHPGVAIHCMDVLDTSAALGSYDYIVMNGVFTRRETLGHEQMLDYLAALTARVFDHARKGMAFNVMSCHADWYGPALFHPRFDELCSIISKSLSPRFVLRNDYGLYECTCYVYRQEICDRARRHRPRP
jgi:SAM-dependent methyltransferase